jgi:lysylphosphatidylglycerol synthase-like protein
VGPVRSIGNLIRFSCGLLLPILGVGLLAYMVFRTGQGAVWKQIRGVGWGLAVVIILGGLAQLVKTWAWRQTFTCDISALSWSHSLGAQLASDAAGQFGFAGKLLGEGLRVSMIAANVPIADGISSSAIDGALHIFTAAVVTVVGITATLLFAPLSDSLRVYALLVVGVLVAVMALAGVAVANRWHLMGNAARAIARFPWFKRFVLHKLPTIDSAERNLLTFYRQNPGAFYANLTLNSLWHSMAVLEVYLILYFMGIRIGVAGACAVEGLTKVINLVGAVSPGNFGTYEGGNILLATLLGVSGPAGLTLALCRRARAVFWAAIGAACVAIMSRGRAVSMIGVKSDDEDPPLRNACIPAASGGPCD